MGIINAPFSERGLFMVLNFFTLYDIMLVRKGVYKMNMNMKFTLSPQFYNKQREFIFPKCKLKIFFTFSQLGKTIICPRCRTKIHLEDNITPRFKKL